MGHKLRDGPTKVAFAERNEAIETFLLDRANEAFSVGVRIRRAIRVWMTRSPASCNRARTASLHFASRSQIRTVYTCPPAGVTVRATWRMNASSRCGVDPRIWTRREASSMTKTV
jgi:hypothetical protein